MTFYDRDNDTHPASAYAYMDNPPAVGAPPRWQFGYLPCGCRNNGHGRHFYG